MKTLMSYLIKAFLVGVGIFSSVQAYAEAPLTVQIPDRKFVVLAFHDERERVLTEVDHDPYAMSTTRLANFFDWIQQHDLHPVSLTAILDAQQGHSKLPKNAVLLTFDDGPKSNYTQLFPLLKSYQYPALLALQTGWISGDVKIDLYGKDGFVTWDQLREMKASGLVEFATHSHNLHQGIVANPQGNLEPAAIIRLFNPTTNSYEAESVYVKRIQDDLNYSANLIEKELGIRPIAVVWPYGAMNDQTREIAKSVGLPISFSLGDENVNSVDSVYTPISRVLIARSPTSVEIEQQIDSVLTTQPTIQRAIEIDLDQLYDSDPVQVNIKLGMLLDRIKAFSIQSVYLKAFSDQNGDGIASQLYFPNRHLPMRADLFNRVAWQLRTRADVRVYAVLPLLAFQLPDQSQQQSHLNPFLPESSQIVSDIYEDLGKNSPGINGILMSSDTSMTHNEADNSCLPAARWPKTGLKIVDCLHLTEKQKTTALIDFSDIAVAGLLHQKDSSTFFNIARRVSASDALNSYSDLDQFVQHYDEVVLMMPVAQGRAMTKQWMPLIDHIAKIPNGLNKVTFELLAKSPRDSQSLHGLQLRQKMEMLTRHGARNLSYYPDDFMKNVPAFDDVYAGISLNSFPELYQSPVKSQPNPNTTKGDQK
ncbi:MAG: poly-beta-1,6-N-acetyl-D-glucosamine N-deacetylase PgaB [Gammaproteobacteria bacterium]|nr:poly-beta-1,6-N-acetyl-D-glucosamine N-deacetylase PgaB [Gammaproteobacteria bacterium]